ncbi:CD276 antigen-like isoform X2 [Colossoma macropomum]|uniref:CD276 antigen-like isoform X2 n=1 Tax=Colossoma macropomum TaxID=42526 RepID=UPI0018651D1B|nr:CD276 antigen-like isoform X2 [Colossoma macropomum]
MDNIDWFVVKFCPLVRIPTTVKKSESESFSTAVVTNSRKLHIVPEVPHLMGNMIIQKHGDTVVHSFYLGRDQLERQGQIYKGRTRLLMDQVLKGNASLSLNNVQQHHHGEYTCDVNNETGETKKRVRLIVAAPYEDPQMAVHYTCNDVVVTLSSSQGFPEPTVSWKHPVGRNVTTTELDTKGFYRVQSNLTFSFNTTQTVIVEMSLDILSQRFIREITLHPLQGCHVSHPVHIRSKVLLILTLLVYILVLLLLLITTGRVSTSEKDSSSASSSSSVLKLIVEKTL